MSVALTLDLLSWIDVRPRTYDETIEAWKTSCPRLSVWDDAVIDGLVRIDRSAENGPVVVLTAPGRKALADAAPDKRRFGIGASVSTIPRG